MHDTRIVCKSPEARSVLRARLLALARSIEADSAGPGADVYTWMAFECLDNDMDLRVFARTKDRTALDKLSRRPEVVNFWKESREGEIERIDQRGYVPNGKGWLHR